MAKKRSKLEIIHDILLCIRNRKKPIARTHILYKANLSHQMLDSYLSELEDKGFISIILIKKRKFYELTDNGFKCIIDLKDINTRLYQLNL